MLIALVIEVHLLPMGPTVVVGGKQRPDIPTRSVPRLTHLEEEGGGLGVAVVASPGRGGVGVTVPLVQRKVPPVVFAGVAFEVPVGIQKLLSSIWGRVG